MIGFGQASQLISISALRQEFVSAPAFSRTDVKRLMRTAHTSEDFRQLAGYFDRQAQIYAAKHESEEKELCRLLALPYHARSYSAQLEGARTRVSRYEALSRKCSAQAALYRARVETNETSIAIPDPPGN